MAFRHSPSITFAIRIQRYYFFRNNLYTSANYSAFLLFFSANGIFLCDLCSAVLVPLCFLASSCMAFHVHYLCSSGEYCILPHLIYTLYISRDFQNSSFPSCFHQDRRAVFNISACRDVISLHRQTAVLAACCSRWGEYNPRHARQR